MPGVADVVRRFGSGYLTRYGATMLPSHRRALRDLAACRTATLGGHVSRCDHCGTEHFTYHSCRNRSCPTCHSAATTAWLAARETELLPVPYFHVVFTLPSELRELVRAHQRVLLSLLMTSAAEGLQALAADGHYVGGTLGILAVLHTWTRALVYHPHVHCLVPAAALASDRRTWRSPRGNFLVPVRALSVRFRARFLARLQAALPDAVVPAVVWQKPWVVYCKPTVQGSTLVLRYLARYVHRVAISNARVQSVTGDRVTFSYKDVEARAWRRMTLSGEEFLRRFLQHVLPRGFHKVRSYGLWRPTAAGLRAAFPQHLAPRSSAPAALPVPATPTPTARDPAIGGAASSPGLSLRRCPQCARGFLHLVARIPRVPSTLVATGIPP